LAHDDGQSFFDVNDADIILIGASRTSKSPTSIYLAYRGYKTANIPFVKGQKLPNINERVLVVGLTINPERLVDIRKNRMINLNEKNSNNYVNYEYVHQEIIEARKIYQENNWPIIDVTRKSVEETAANIIKIYEQKKLI
jgi:[pyruvate, water dikinase]-phosphate phosphotransferase / [pyruvate, water dikinase] kinase